MPKKLKFLLTHVRMQRSEFTPGITLVRFYRCSLQGVLEHMVHKFVRFCLFLFKSGEYLLLLLNLLECKYLHPCRQDVFLNCILKMVKRKIHEQCELLDLCVSLTLLKMYSMLVKFSK